MLSQRDRRRTERCPLSIPIRVLGLDPARGRFFEDTQTIVVNQAGATIRLKHRVFPGDFIRIINLENFSRAYFHVRGRTGALGTEVGEWGVECFDKECNIWGVPFSPPPVSPGFDAALLLQCPACGKKAFWPVTLTELEALNSTGAVPRDCDQCGNRTHWSYSTNRQRETSTSEPAAPPAGVAEVKRDVERRIHKRLSLKLLLLLRNQKGEEEVRRTENVTKAGLAVSLSMDLSVGDSVNIVCPYTPGGQNIEQKAEIRWAQTNSSCPRMYGLRYLWLLRLLPTAPR